MTPPKKRHHQDRHISVRAVPRDEPDLRKFASAVIALAQAQAEAETQAQYEKNSNTTGDSPPLPPSEGAA
jgi:hypothetical protein